ncbi:MAG TPA: VWA domain-containing protein [Terriglobales bacterium]|nr:VWA domain-containing protein [Terriglobales bacterium]
MRPFRAGVDLVQVPVTVTDTMGRPVLGLKLENFTVLDNGVPQPIRHFGSDDAPISIGVILDLSASMADKIDYARDAVREFFNTANPDDDYFLITFADRPEVLADVSSSIPTMEAKLATATPSGHTALLDAIYLGLERAKWARYQRRALLIISDGGDNRSRFRARELKDIVEEADVEVFAIGIYSAFFHTPEEWAGKRLLTDITESSGGHTVTLSNPRDLPRIAADLSLQMRNQYVLGFRPPENGRDGKWHDLKVVVTNGETPMQVHWKRGYNGPAQ